MAIVVWNFTGILFRLISLVIIITGLNIAYGIPLIITLLMIDYTIHYLYACFTLRTPVSICRKPPAFGYNSQRYRQISCQYH